MNLELNLEPISVNPYLNQLQSIADEKDTHVNYLLENGLQNVLAQGIITYNKESRPKDRVQYKTTYDQELLDKLKSLLSSIIYLLMMSLNIVLNLSILVHIKIAVTNIE